MCEHCLLSGFSRCSLCDGITDVCDSACCICLFFPATSSVNSTDMTKKLQTSELLGQGAPNPATMFFTLKIQL